MQLGFLFKPLPHSPHPQAAILTVGTRIIPLHFIRNPKARRYILRLQPDGSLRATVPRSGSIKEARAFARGKRIPLNVSQNHDSSVVQFADQKLSTHTTTNLRFTIERHLWKLAATELTARTIELARLHNLTVKRVTIRNQRSRWGSCSRRGTISLNWRLVQMPDTVRDYIILHELAHTVEHNHSVRFWRLGESLCPHYKEARIWVRRHRE